MSLRADTLEAGALRGVILTFEKAGDVLDMHRHTEHDVHITVVCRGSFRCHGPEIGESIYRAGAVLDWDAGVDHEFIALEDDGRIVNILKNG